MGGESVSEGWFPDPWGEAPLRWWDGSEWTGYTSDPVVPPGGLSHVLGEGGRLAVLDVESTGLYRTDRVLEVGVVVLDHSGTVVEEFTSLVDPGRDVGPVWVHGVTPSMLTGAPVFSEVAAGLAAVLDGAVVCAHNLPFDRRMLGAEFERVGVVVDWGSGVDTLSLSGAKLADACEAAGVALVGAHSALGDARGTAGLVLAHASAVGGPLVPARVDLSGASLAPVRVLSRESSAADSEDAAMQAAAVAGAVLDRSPFTAAPAVEPEGAEGVAAYLDLLRLALADLRLTPDERVELGSLAVNLGLSAAQVGAAHAAYVAALVAAAVEDRVVTAEEFEVLLRVCALLDVDAELVVARTDGLRSELVLVEVTPGMSVCFTGEAFGPGDPLEREHLLRDDLEMLCVRAGLDPVRQVTAKGCDLLVAADPASRSGKAAKARKWGIPVVSVENFLAFLDGNGGPLEGSVLSSPGVALVCSSCGGTWLAERRSAKPLCGECRPVPRRSGGAAAAALPPPAEGSMVSEGAASAPPSEELVCSECGRSWVRVRTRGRKPRCCPDCV